MHTGNTGHAVPREQPRTTRTGREEDASYVYLDCATCGRPLRVHVQHLGKWVACGHCGHEFEAINPATARHSAASTLERADELLLRFAAMRAG